MFDVRQLSITCGAFAQYRPAERNFSNIQLTAPFLLLRPILCDTPPNRYGLLRVWPKGSHIVDRGFECGDCYWQESFWRSR
jgi:hypothetical protein